MQDCSAIRNYSVYLNEEIREEAISRNLQSFSHFMEVAAQCDGEMVVYKNIAQDCGIDQRTVKSYFEVLEDTLLGFFIPAYTASKKRRAILSPKFYYYDVGIVNYLLGRRNMIVLHPQGLQFRDVSRLIGEGGNVALLCPVKSLAL